MQTDLKLNHVVDLTCNLLATDLDVEEGCIIDQDAFDEDRVPDSHHHVAPTGNEGAQETRWYRDSLVVLVGSRKKIGWLRRADGGRYAGTGVSLLVLLREFQHRAGSEERHAVAELEQLCDAVITESTQGVQRRRRYTWQGLRKIKISHSDEVISSVVNTFLEQKGVDRLRDAFTALQGKLSVKSFQRAGRSGVEIEALRTL